MWRAGRSRRCLRARACGSPTATNSITAMCGFGRRRCSWRAISLAGFAKRIFGLVMLAPLLTFSMALNFIAVAMLPRPRADRPKGDFALRLRATLGETRELLRCSRVSDLPCRCQPRSGIARFLLCLWRVALDAAGLQRPVDRHHLAARRVCRNRVDVVFAARVPRHWAPRGFWFWAAWAACCAGRSLPSIRRWRW